ncbi:acyl-phosphate glycerol 3-phosphate acyltransferase [Leptolyngbya sp. BL0902]|nr:acyl-phosphate glycerol 3-phosphate acyltransferase [Leptolyngbya sp. BL0902]
MGILGLAYLLGSFPTGFLLVKALKGIDIRDYGSGGTGATNVLRTVGKGPALIVFVVDLLKGSAAVWMAQWAFPLLLAHWGESSSVVFSPGFQPWVDMLAGLMALLGHSRSVWLGFTGGKSVASGLGVLLAMAWPVALGALGVFGLTLALSRIVSLGSMLAALAAILLMILTQQPLAYTLLALLGGGYVILRHRGNIQRLLAGTEPRIGQSSPASHPRSTES